MTRLPRSQGIGVQEWQIVSIRSAYRSADRSFVFARLRHGDAASFGGVADGRPKA